MKIAITVESTSDLSKEQLQTNDIRVLPYKIVLKDKEIVDGEMTSSELFEYVDKTNTLPKTNAVNEFEYTEFFEEIRKDYDGIVHIALSSGLTSSCGNAERAAKNVDNVFVVDSLSLSAGIGLLALYARSLANKGLSAEEIFNKLENRKADLDTSFVIDRLDYLHKGGRCSSLQLLGANIFKIHPSIAMKDGSLGMDKKYRGPMVSVIEKYCMEKFAEFPNADKEVVFIAYSSATEEMLQVAKNCCSNAGFKQIIPAQAGGTICAHCGPNTVGVMFFGKSE